MIKEKLMEALKKAAEDYNDGMGASSAVADAARDFDFNEKQAERLTEMFNTTLALKKQADCSDPTGSCELADKRAVARLLLEGGPAHKEASAPADYSFYFSVPEKTNLSIESRRSGAESMLKAASASEEREPDELNVSQLSLCKIIDGKIAMLKAASAAADDVVRNLLIEAESGVVKIARAIEDPYADPHAADLFRVACPFPRVVERVAEYSTKVAESDGGAFARMHVFDASDVDSLVKAAEDIDGYMSLVPEYEKKRDFYMEKASEFQDEMLEAVGLKETEKEDAGSIAGMFQGVQKKASGDECVTDAKPEGADSDSGSATIAKIAELIRQSGVSADSVASLAEDLEKEAVNLPLSIGIPVPSMADALNSMSPSLKADNERNVVLNTRRSIILADLMSNDPIIRDADPNQVVEVYKTMVMTSPRVSLDKAQVRSFLRSAVNSIAVSPSDALVISDVDRGIASSSIDRLTSLDSSIKDSNKV